MRVWAPLVEEHSQSESVVPKCAAAAVALSMLVLYAVWYMVCSAYIFSGSSLHFRRYLVLFLYCIFLPQELFLLFQTKRVCLFNLGL